MVLKFSIQIENQFGYNWKQIKEIVRKTEEYEYHSFFICDHFFLDKNSEERNTLEAWTVLTAAAMITQNIKLGTLVTGNNYRKPSLLAKIAASLDMISNGRLEFGIGAGWKEVEYEAYGYRFPPVKERMDQLEESLQIIKALWTQPRTTFKGDYYQIKDAVFAPKPVQNNPLIIVGGGGEKRTLQMVAKYADYCNLFDMPLKDFERKLNALKRHAKDVGRDYEDIGKSLFTSMWVSESQDEVDNYLDTIAERYNRNLTEMKERIYPVDKPGGWIGTPEQIRERIDFMKGLGFDYFFFQQPISLTSEMVGKFANLVKNKYYK